MATTISINDTLRLDQTVGLQDDDLAIDSTLTGLSATFKAFLLGLGGDLTLSAGQLSYAAAVEAAKSGSGYVTVDPSGGSISNLFFSDPNGVALDGDQVIYDGSPLQTLDGSNIYLWSYAGGDIVLATTSSIAGAGDVVAAFYLNETGDHLSASIEMVTFIPIAHPDSADPDDAIDFTDLLNVSGSGTLEFKFDNLESGNFLWVAIGSSSAGLLVTGQDLNVNNNAGSKEGDLVNGGSDPCDTMNTSQGGINATIGVNSQHFVGGPKVAGVLTDGPTAVFTLVTDYVPLAGGTGQATGGNVKQIDYGNYINVSAASIFISQVTGGSNTKIDIKLWEAGGGDNTEHSTASLTPEEGYTGANSYIGNENTDSHLHDDTPVGVASVQIGALTWLYTEANIATTGVTKGGITVKISGNDIQVNGPLSAGTTIKFTAIDDAGSLIDGTFNRFAVEGLAGTGAFDIGKIILDQGLTVTTPVGDSLFVDDDGPTLTGQGASEKVVEDELSVAAADGDNSTGNTDNDGDSDEASFSNAELQVTLDSGTDAPAQFALDLSVSGAVTDTNGDAVTSQGVAVTYAVIGGVVWGMAGAREVFKLWQSAGAGDDDPTNDVFSIDLRDQVDHAPASGDDGTMAINLTPAFMATDADGDLADLNGPGGGAMPITLIIENDVPELTGQTSTKKVVEDELKVSDGDGDLSTGRTDGDADSDETTYAYNDFLGIVTVGGDEPVTIQMNTAITGNVYDVDGNVVTSKGVALVYQSVGGHVEAVAGSRVVFTVTKTSGGGTPDDSTDDVYTVDLRDQIDHADGSGDDGTLTIDLAPAFLIYDKDGDQVDLSAPGHELSPIQLIVENDVPAITAQILDGAVDFSVGDSVSNSLNGSIGGDDNSATDQTAAGTKTYTFDTYSTPTNAIANLTAVESADGTKIEYYSGTKLMYDIVLGQSGAGDYTFTVHEPPPQQITPFDFSDLPSGQNLFGIIAANKANLDGTALFVIGSDVHLKADGTFVTSGANASDTINTSKGGGPVTIGNGNQMFDPHEGCFFVYLDNPADNAVAGVTGGLTQNTADDADTVKFAGTHEVRSASFEVVQVQGNALATIDLKAYDIDMAPFGAGGVNTDAESRAFCNDPVATDDLVNITAVRVVQNGVVLESWVDSDLDGVYEQLTNSSTIGVTFTETSAGSGIYTARVSGVAAGYEVQFDTEQAHDAALIEGVAGKYDLGGFNLLEGQDTPDQLFDFSVQINDYDGDSDGGSALAYANFSVLVDGTGTYDDPLIP